MASAGPSLRPYEKRSLSISAPSNEHNASSSLIEMRCFRVWWRVALVAHDPNAFPVESLKKPHVLSTYNPALRAIQKQREHERP